MDHEMNGQAEAKPGLFLNIPLEIARRDDLTPCAKLAYGMINALCRINGGVCISSNADLADSIGMCESSFRVVLRALIRKRLVRRKLHDHIRESLSIAGGDAGVKRPSMPGKPAGGNGQGSAPKGERNPTIPVSEIQPGGVSEIQAPGVVEIPPGGGRDPARGVSEKHPGKLVQIPPGGWRDLDERNSLTEEKRETLQVSLSSQTHADAGADAREASAGPSAREAPGPASARRKKSGKTGAEIEAERREMDASMRETRRVEQHIADLSEAPMDDPIIRREMEARAAGEMAVLLPDPAIVPPVEIVRPHVIAMRAALEARKAGGQ